MANVKYITDLIDEESDLVRKVPPNHYRTGKPASNQKSKNSGHEDFPPAKLYTGSPDVWINRMPATRRYDLFKEHCNELECHKGMTQFGSNTVSINGLPANRVGDPIYLTYDWSEGVGSINDILYPKPVVCQPEVGVGGTETYPSLTVHKEDVEDLEFQYLTHPLLSLCWSLYEEDFRKPFISGVGIPMGGCASAIMTGSDDVYIGYKDEQIHRF